MMSEPTADEVVEEIEVVEVEDAEELDGTVADEVDDGGLGAPSLQAALQALDFRHPAGDSPAFTALQAAMAALDIAIAARLLPMQGAKSGCYNGEVVHSDLLGGDSMFFFPKLAARKAFSSPS